MLTRILKTWALLMLSTVVALGGVAGLLSLGLFLHRIDPVFGVIAVGVLLLFVLAVLLELK